MIAMGIALGSLAIIAATTGAFLFWRQRQSLNAELTAKRKGPPGASISAC